LQKDRPQKVFAPSSIRVTLNIANGKAIIMTDTSFLVSSPHPAAIIPLASEVVEKLG
jgi:hypothetical protein